MGVGAHQARGLVGSLSKNPEEGMDIGYLGNTEGKLPSLRKFGNVRVISN